MSKSKKTMQWPMPLLPMWGWFGDVDEYKEKWEEFKSTVDTFWDQMIEMQKTSMEAWKEQWDKAFPQLMEMQDKITDNLPEELPTPPGAPVNPIKPKEVMSKVREFQEMANQHAVEQADSALDFCKKGQEQVKATVTETVDKNEEQLD